MKRVLGLFILAGFIIGAPQAGPLSGQSTVKADLNRILGTWSLEVYADGQIIYLSLLLETKNGEVGGKISEQTGFFTDAPVTNVKFEGDTLTFDITVSSPPDGLVRTWQSQLNVGEDAVEGTISNAELAVSALTTGKREKKNPK